jgi:hypothetical protein
MPTDFQNHPKIILIIKKKETQCWVTSFNKAMKDQVILTHLNQTDNKN